MAVPSYYLRDGTNVVEYPITTEGFNNYLAARVRKLTAVIANITQASAIAVLINDDFRIVLYEAVNSFVDPTTSLVYLYSNYIVPLTSDATKAATDKITFIAQRTLNDRLYRSLKVVMLSPRALPNIFSWASNSPPAFVTRPLYSCLARLVLSSKVSKLTMDAILSFFITHNAAHGQEHFAASATLAAALHQVGLQIPREMYLKYLAYDVRTTFSDLCTISIKSLSHGVVTPLMAQQRAQWLNGVAKGGELLEDNNFMLALVLDQLCRYHGVAREKSAYSRANKLDFVTAMWDIVYDKPLNPGALTVLMAAVREVAQGPVSDNSKFATYICDIAQHVGVFSFSTEDRELLKGWATRHDQGQVVFCLTSEVE